MRFIAVGDIHMDWANLARIPESETAALLLIPEAGQLHARLETLQGTRP